MATTATDRRTNAHRSNEQQRETETKRGETQTPKEQHIMRETAGLYLGEGDLDGCRVVLHLNRRLSVQLQPGQRDLVHVQRQIGRVLICTHRRTHRAVNNQRERTTTEKEKDTRCSRDKQTHNNTGARRRRTSLNETEKGTSELDKRIRCAAVEQIRRPGAIGARRPVIEILLHNDRDVCTVLIDSAGSLENGRNEK